MPPFCKNREFWPVMACSGVGRRDIRASKRRADTLLRAGEPADCPLRDRHSAARLKPRDLVLVDMAAQQDGYCSDMTRMLFLGAPTAKVKLVYRAVLEAQLAACDGPR